MKQISVLPPSLKLLPAFILRQTSWRTCLALAALVAALCAGQAWALTFAHITDIHVDKDSEKDPQGKNFAKMVTKMQTLNPAFIIASGDLVDHGMKASGINTIIDNDNWNYLTIRMYKNNNTWYANSAKTIPIFFTPGNHDSRTTSADIMESQIIMAQSLEGYDANIPRTPDGAVSGSTVSSEADRDYYIIMKDTALVISLYSGRDSWAIPMRGALMNPESDGLKPGQLTFLLQTLQQNKAGTLPNHAGKTYVPIIFMHSPAVDEHGWDYKGDRTDQTIDIQGFDDGCIYNKRDEFMNALDANKVVFSGTDVYPVVFQGHVEQNVVLDRNGNLRDENWTGGVRYVQTAGCFDGAYRMITINSNKTVSIGTPKLVEGVYPSVQITSIDENSFVIQGATYTIKSEVHAVNGVQKVEYFINGVLKQTVTQPPYLYDCLADFTFKSTSMTISAKAYGGGGASDTNRVTLAVNKSQGGDSYYSRMNVGDVAYVKDPLTGNTLPCEIVNVDVSGGVRYAAVSVNGDVRTVNVGQMEKVPNTGLFLYAATVFTGDIGYRFTELMIAPYQYPSLDILAPEPGISTNSNIVQVAVNYSGKNIPWNGVGSPPVPTRDLKTITYGTTPSVNESYIWYLSGANGLRTLTITLRDCRGDLVTKSVTVNYDNAKPFYDYRGPFGQTWENRSLSVTTCSGNDACIWFNFWTGSDPGGTHWGGSCMASSRDEVVSRIAEYIITGALSQGVPGGATTVYVVDKAEYTSGSIELGPFGTATFQEIYDKVAFRLGKDKDNKYRVWASANKYPNISPADAIPCLHLPVPPAPIYSNIQRTSLQVNWTNLEGETGYQLQRSSNNVNWTTLSMPGADVTNYTDATVTANTGYWYRVIGTGCSNQTGLSSPITTMNADGVTNGSFELASGWTTTTSGRGRVFLNETDGSFDGSPYGKAAIIPNPGFTSDGSAYITQTIQIPNDALRINFAVKAYGTGTMGPQFCVFLKDIQLESYDRPNLAWTKRSHNIPSSYRGQTATFGFYASNSGFGTGDIGIDDVSIIGTPPVVAITSPAAGVGINVNTPITITATATDLAGINRVEFFANDVYIGQSTTSPYTCTWTPTVAKSYTVRAVAYDNSGNSSVATGYNGIVNGDFEGAGGWPAPCNNTDPIRQSRVIFEIVSGGPYGKYGRSYVNNGISGGSASIDIWQTFRVPLDATTLQFRKDGGYATFNGVAITPDVNGWGLSTVDLIPYRGHSVTVNINTSISSQTGNQWAESKFDNFVVNREITVDLSTVTVTATGEVACYKLDASMGTVATDNSGNDNQGTLANGPTWVAGQVNNCLSFDGVDDYVNVPNSASINPASITIAMWLNLRNDPNVDGNNNWRSLLHKGSTCGTATGYDIVLEEGRDICWDTGTNTPDRFWPGISIPIGSWTHLAVTYDAASGVKKVYQDGVLKNSKTVNALPLLSNTSDLLINNPSVQYPNGAGNMPGLIDEVRIYNRALSEAEIKASAIKVVYYDTRYPVAWISRAEATAYRDNLVSKGYTEVNADQLKTYMQSNGAGTVVVVAQDACPSTVADVQSSNAIIRQYLNRGGTVVWLQDIPFYYVGNSDGSMPAWGTAGMQNILGISMGTWNVGDMVAITADGAARGLKQTWTSIRPVQSSQVSKVYASASGGAAAWLKNYYPADPNSGFIRLWDNAGDFISTAYLNDLRATLSKRVVYYDTRYPVAWISRAEATAYRDNLVSNGYIEMNADQLKTYMQSNGAGTVVVMAQDACPATVADVQSSNAIIRQYLNRGGTVVWLQDIPFYYVGNSDGSMPAWGTAGMENILGVSCGTLNVGDVVAITADGAARGLKQTWTSIRPVQSSHVSKVYARASGGAAAWLKNYYSGDPNSGFIRLWDNAGDFISTAYLGDLLFSAGNSKASSSTVVADAETLERSLPGDTKLILNVPNPFASQTVINFQLAKPAQTTIKVYNLMGQVVKTLVNECLRPGYHSVKWDGRDANGNKVAAGVYLYRMQAGDYSNTNKMTLLR